MKDTAQILSVLENTKFSPENELGTLDIALNLLLQHAETLWKKGTKDREFLLELSAGTKALGREAWQKNKGLEPLVCFMQGCLLLSLSLLNGIGRAPIATQKTGSKYKVKILNKLQTLELTPGQFDAETEKLLREFKQAFYGRTAEPVFGKNDLALIKGALQETLLRLKREQAFMQNLAQDPLQIFKDNVAADYFASGLFAIIAALPADTMNMLLMHTGSYLPGDLEETTDDRLSVNVRAYLCASTQNLPELFKKLRLLLKTYFGKQRGIISIIIRDKLQDFFYRLLDNASVKNQLREHLTATAAEQFGLRIKTFDGLVKLL